MNAGTQTQSQNGVIHNRNGDTLLRSATTASSTQKHPKFIWGAGIECSFIPHLNVDQFDWTQHSRFWADDFKLARDELGVTALRYAFPWHLLEPTRGTFDWSLADARVEACKKLGIALYLDVMHFGTPLWLKQAAGDPEFPEALEQFTEALVGRYRESVSTWCPCNEPLVLALFSGDFGFWPPHGRGWRGYMPVLSRIVQGVSRSIRAIRRVQPEAKVLLCDHVENYKTREPELADEVRRRNQRRFLALDLLTGRLDRRHPLFDWVTAYGLSELDLEWFRSNPQFPSVLGLDYYANSEWQLEQHHQEIRQRRTESPVGIYGIGSAYYQRYGLPMMLTETSIDGKAINREIWLEQTVSDCRRLREEGVPLLGYFWWPLIDQVDWDGALTHRVGKIHEVGLFNLHRSADGTLTRHATPLVKQFARIVDQGDEAAGTIAEIYVPAPRHDDDTPIGVEAQPRASRPSPALPAADASASVASASANDRKTDAYGILVFSHLRWGFVWQRPQQFLSRFARKHRILFIEEPFFDLAAGQPPRIDYHKVMPNVTVVTPHVAPEWHRNPKLPAELRRFTHQALENVNDDGDFERPLLWYYSPMDSAWSLGHFENRGVVYDCMDELSQFSGAPRALVQNEARLMQNADIVFTGGYELGEKKRSEHPNVHTFGCGVEYDHFSKADQDDTAVPPDIDFVGRPVIGWFGVVDERVDYSLIGEMARLRPDWSFTIIGPVVKIDPNILPHSPNLYWMGGRDYQVLPNYCRKFDVCMMPFAINAATQYINPTKGLEYMATGRPIVSTPVRDVVRQWSEIIRVASGSGDFLAAIEDALARRGGDPRVDRGIKLAQQCSWDSTVSKMQSLIGEAISKHQRNARAVEPLPEAELEYAYASTQGS
jgi:beta-glucosidase/6-phospho-beta-glucosidase/beta-galactosidase/glycosyltransferase involved in cell wall biosynthesis